jgi:predicted ATPase
LADGEIAELVTGLLPADVASADRVTAVVGAADGNPLYAKELAYAGPQALPASITDAVLAKAAGLTAQARAVVDQVCVADGGMSHELLAAAVPLPEKRLLASARRAVASGLLVPVGDGYALSHALTRQVLYAHLLPGERRHLHHRLAEALAARPDSDPGLLAQHWHLAGAPDRAGPAAVLAARQAVAERAYPEAVRSYALAIELAAWLPETGPALLEEAARAASWAGDPDRAAGWIADALAQSGEAAPADRTRLLERLGRYRFDARDLNAAVDATEQALALLPAAQPGYRPSRAACRRSAAGRPGSVPVGRHHHRGGEAVPRPQHPPEPHRLATRAGPVLAVANRPNPALSGLPAVPGHRPGCAGAGHHRRDERAHLPQHPDRGHLGRSRSVERCRPGLRRSRPGPRLTSPAQRAAGA